MVASTIPDRPKGGRGTHASWLCFRLGLAYADKKQEDWKMEGLQYRQARQEHCTVQKECPNEDVVFVGAPSNDLLSLRHTGFPLTASSGLKAQASQTTAN